MDGCFKGQVSIFSGIFTTKAFLGSGQAPSTNAQKLQECSATNSYACQVPNKWNQSKLQLILGASFLDITLVPKQSFDEPPGPWGRFGWRGGAFRINCRTFRLFSFIRFSAAIRLYAPKPWLEHVSRPKFRKRWDSIRMFFFVFHKQRAYQIRLIRACCLDITTRDLTPSSKLSWPALLKDQNATQKVNMSLKLRCLLHLLRQHGFFMASRIRSLFLPFAAAWDISPSSAVSMQRTWFKFKLLIVFITLDVDWIEELEDSDSQFDETASSDSPESESGAS